MMDRISFGLRIQNARQNAHLSQEELAAILGISRPFLAYIEIGARLPGLETFLEIANALEISANDLLLDSLVNSGDAVDNDLQYLLLDCSTAETAIIKETVKSLKNSLQQYKIN